MTGKAKVSAKDRQWLSEALGLSEADTPFPWQLELLRKFLDGEIPSHLDIPTGMGKTSVMAIWLVARALDANLPRRLVYAVDRRAVVDQSTEVALHLRKWVDGNAEVKDKLGLGSPLAISTLRGQHIDNREWLQDPTLSAIVVGTVDMIGSRLLFKGYGTSRNIRPYQAGLLGSDVLAVLDEAHLVQPFQKLLSAIETGKSTFGPQRDVSDIIPPFHLMTLTATAQSNGGTTFGLTKEDFKHEIVKKRLQATKRLKLEPISDQKMLPDALAEHAWSLVGNGRTDKRVIVFCNYPKDAEKVKTKVEKLAKRDKIDTELFVGARRVYEREGMVQRLRERGFMVRSEDESDTEHNVQRPAFVFATSAGEVGVDLDAEHMVCDLVAWERMVQRLGRVNRRGEGCASAVVIYDEYKPNAAIEKELDDRTNKEKREVDEYEQRVARLNALERLPRSNGVIDASPGAIRDLRRRAEFDRRLRDELNEASTKPPLHPQLSRALVDAWSMTSLEKHTGRPDVQPWIRGWDEDSPQTTVLWRKYLPVRTDGRPGAKKEVERYFEAAPPHMSEKLETYTSEVAVWLEKRAIATLRASGVAADNQAMDRNVTAAFVLDNAGKMKKTLPLGCLDLSNLDSKAAKAKRDNLKSILVGAMLVVDARIAGLSASGRLDQSNRSSSPPRTSDDGGTWLPAEDGVPVTRFLVRKVPFGNGQTDDSYTPAPVAGWRQRLRLAIELSEDGEAQQWLVVYKWQSDASMEEDRSSGPLQLLDEHQRWAERHARAIATKIGLPDDYVETLSIAAKLHDEGKRVRQWQRAFNAPLNGDIYAKTLGPVNFRLLGNYRHEFGSLAYAERSSSLKVLPDDLRDLALHLITAHHGFARPFISVNGCEDAPPSELEKRAQEVAMRFAKLQKRWGPWGLAWWEALLRSADWKASSDNEHGNTQDTVQEAA